MPIADQLSRYRGNPGRYDSQGLQQPMIDPVQLITSLLGPALLSMGSNVAENAPRMLGNEAGALFPKGYAEEKFSTSLPVKAYTEPGVPFYDEIKGMNKGHALWRAKGNWPGVEVQPTGISPQNFDKAQRIMDMLAKLRQQVNHLTSHQ